MYSLWFSAIENNIQYSQGFDWSKIDPQESVAMTEKDDKTKIELLTKCMTDYIFSNLPKDESKRHKLIVMKTLAFLSLINGVGYLEPSAKYRMIPVRYKISLNEKTWKHRLSTCKKYILNWYDKRERTTK